RRPDAGPVQGDLGHGPAADLQDGDSPLGPDLQDALEGARAGHRPNPAPYVAAARGEGVQVETRHVLVDLGPVPEAAPGRREGLQGGLSGAAVTADPERETCPEQSPVVGVGVQVHLGARRFGAHGEPGRAIVRGARRRGRTVARGVGRPLSRIRYRDRKHRPKVVSYWTMTQGEGSFRPTDEVDELRWASVQEAPSLLTYTHDRELLAEAIGAG